MSKRNFIIVLLLGIIIIGTGCQETARIAPTPSPNVWPVKIAESIREPNIPAPRTVPSPNPQLSLQPQPANQVSPVPEKLPKQTNKFLVQKPQATPKLEKTKPKSPGKKVFRTSPKDSNRKIAYLTFDDGPSRVTGRVLNTLKRYKVKATFFVIGNATLEGRSLYKRIVSEGHAIGNHSYSHNYKQIYQSVDTFERDVNKLNKLLEQTISFRPDIIRFPGGSNNTVSYRAGGRHIMHKIASEVTHQGYQYFDWNVDSSDASAAVRSKAQIVSSVKREVAGQNRIIVLMHDAPGRSTTADALPEVIEYLQGQGYQFEKLNKSAFTCQFLLP
jgi:peptidoglycan-N-acetylglucosamine deacetylase